MRFKLDEHFDARLAALVAEGGHDVETLVREGLGGADDDAVYDACRREERTLVTLDLDFSNPLRFPPGVTEGIVVVRPPRNVLTLVVDVLQDALVQRMMMPRTFRTPGRSAELPSRKASTNVR